MNVLAAVLCVFLFGQTAPFTRVATLAISPDSVILLRILIASIVCIVFVLRDRWVPPKSAWPGILRTALGTVIGFNSFMAYGLSEVPAGHAAVALAGLPMVTAIYSILRDRLNPGFRFWAFSLLGTLFSVSFFFLLNVKEVQHGDLILLLAVLSAAFGYVEGGRTGRIYGGARTMAWAVLLVLPVCLPLALWHFRHTSDSLAAVTLPVAFSILYVGLVSQSLGMLLWLKVLAKGPMEKVSMVQLLQPFFTLLGAIVLLGEEVLGITWVVALLVGICVFGTNREREKAVRHGSEAK
jgi:drug/metabolite transporter (DMT)-like permease